MNLRKHARFLYQPVLPLGKNGKLVTNSKEHWKVALQVTEEGTVRVKNTGKFDGKQVVQVYLTAPQGKLGKAKNAVRL